MKKKKEDISYAYAMITMMKTFFKTCPVLLIFGIILSIIDGTVLASDVYFKQVFFDAAEKSILGQGTFKSAVIKLIILCTVLILGEINNGVSNFLSYYVLKKKARGIIGKRLNSKSSRIDAIKFESPQTLDDINKAWVGLDAGIEMFITIIALIFFYVPYFIFMGVYLYKLKPILAISILLVFVPILLSQIIRTKLFSQVEDKKAPVRREYEYYEKCMVHKEYFKETRLLGGFSYFKDLYTKALKIINNEIWKAEKKAGIIELLMIFITFLGYMGIMSLLFFSLIDGSISLGAFGAVLSSIGLMFEIMNEIICIRIGKIAEKAGAVKNFIRYMNIEERIGEEFDIESPPVIELKNVSFKYPGAKNYSLKNVNLNIKSKETIAIVGENGAGKSTIIKVILGLFPPSDGNVLINGKETSTLSKESLYKNTSAVFQKFQRYNLSLGENIAIGEKNEGYDIKKLDYAIEKADFEMNKEKFKEGYDTMMGREFDGEDLSGGQWQRLAIARSLYKDSLLISLDEPTAAIDPIEETKLFKKFAVMAEDKTAVIVTHRLGSARIADRIVVMDKGEIVQIGTHEELVNVPGKYAEMFKAQGKWYNNEVIA